jgi:hypothetical protein
VGGTLKLHYSDIEWLIHALTRVVLTSLRRSVRKARGLRSSFSMNLKTPNEFFGDKTQKLINLVIYSLTAINYN